VVRTSDFVLRSYGSLSYYLLSHFLVLSPLSLVSLASLDTKCVAQAELKESGYLPEEDVVVPSAASKEEVVAVYGEEEEESKSPEFSRCYSFPRFPFLALPVLFSLLTLLTFSRQQIRLPLEYADLQPHSGALRQLRRENEGFCGTFMFLRCFPLLRPMLTLITPPSPPPP
jgi:hypothetical protein